MDFLKTNLVGDKTPEKLGLIQSTCFFFQFQNQNLQYLSCYSSNLINSIYLREQRLFFKANTGTLKCQKQVEILMLWVFCFYYQLINNDCSSRNDNLIRKQVQGLKNTAVFFIKGGIMSISLGSGGLQLLKTLWPDPLTVSRSGISFSCVSSPTLTSMATEN